MEMRVITITAETCDARREAGTMQPGWYKITDTGADWDHQTLWGFTPDGEGFHWYSSEAAMLRDAA